MQTTDLFEKALQISPPWKVDKVEFKSSNEAQNEIELHISLSFEKGSVFPCPHDDCSEVAKVYDTTQRTWRHLDFFQYRTYIHARLPRINCPEHGVGTVEVPWARNNCGFTLLFESFVVELAKHMPVRALAKITGEQDTLLWRIIHHYVHEARKLEDYSDVTAIGMDETSKKGHNYITVVADIVKKKVIFVTDGKDMKAVEAFAADFTAHNGLCENIVIATCDMSGGFLSAIRKLFVNSEAIIDKFHVIKHANERVNNVRKQEAQERTILKKTRYIWLKNEENLTEKQKTTKQSLMKERLKTARAYVMKTRLQEIYDTPQSREEAEKNLKELCSWMMHSRLEEMKKLAKTIRNHFNEILNYFSYSYTNAILEGLNNIIQNVKGRARGFRNTEYFKTIIYLVCGGLNLDEVLCKA